MVLDTAVALFKMSDTPATSVHVFVPYYILWTRTLYPLYCGLTYCTYCTHPWCCGLTYCRSPICTYTLGTVGSHIAGLTYCTYTLGTVGSHIACTVHTIYLWYCGLTYCGLYKYVSPCYYEISTHWCLQ